MRCPKCRNESHVRIDISIKKSGAINIPFTMHWKCPYCGNKLSQMGISSMVPDSLDME